MTVINPRVLKWFEGRGIDPELVAHIGIFSGTRRTTGAVEPDPNGEIIVFPFFQNGKIVNEKYRAAGKRFWQKTGGVKCFLNSDVLSDIALRRGDVNLNIVEGEPDLLTALQCGFPHTVSVPDGAPPELQGDSDQNPDTDQKFSYIAHDWERLKVIKRITIAVDNDGPGKRLAEELVRRLGRVRCYWVEYPDGCKDLNDVLMRHGPEAVTGILNSAKPYPVHGLYTLAEFPPEPPLNPLSTGWGRMDDLLRVYYPGLMAVTGFANAGKALALDTPIPIPRGWTTMGELRVGDEVYDERGQICHVINATLPMKDRQCYEVMFGDGTKIVADADHQWLTSTVKSRNSLRNRRYRRNGRQYILPRGNDQSHKQTYPSVVTTKEISQTLLAYGRVNNHRIPVAGPVAGIDREAIIHPYMLGVWLGDGTSSNGTITCFDAPILDYIRGLGYRISKQANDGRYNIGGLIYDLRELGVLKNKHIPAQYLRLPVESRLELLRGLMDTDGFCLENGSCEFSVVNQRLAHEFCDLIRGLGMIGVVRASQAKLNGKIVGVRYRVSFTPNCVAFHMPRKFMRQRISSRAKRVNSRAIVACTQVPSVPVRCIQVDSPSKLFLASNSYIPTHNSTWTNQLVAQLALKHGWAAAIASFEMRLDPYVTDTLRAAFLEKPKRLWTLDDIQRANDWINDYFLFISPTDDDDQKDLDWLIERAQAAVIRHGIRVLMIDPWNEIEHSIDRHENRTDYTGRALQSLKRFARTFDCFVIVVGHPTKEGARKKDDAISLYDMADSAHFANKVDLGVVVCRINEAPNLSRILVRKVRYQPDTGCIGELELAYDPDLRLFAQ